MLFSGWWCLLILTGKLPVICETLTFIVAFAIMCRQITSDNWIFTLEYSSLQTHTHTHTVTHLSSHTLVWDWSRFACQPPIYYTFISSLYHSLYTFCIYWPLACTNRNLIHIPTTPPPNHPLPVSHILSTALTPRIGCCCVLKRMRYKEAEFQ